MFRNRSNFLISLLVIYAILLLIFATLIVNKYNFSIKRLPLGEFLKESTLVSYLIELVYLDDLDSKLVLKKGFPVVRVSSDLALEEEVTSNLDLAFNFVVGLPASFFSSQEGQEEIRRASSSNLEGKVEEEEKLEAESSHQDERVEIKLSQRDSTVEDDELEAQNLLEYLKELEDEREEDITFDQEQEFTTPAVGIYHTHTAENYEDPANDFRAQPGEKGDVVAVGKSLTERLENKYGIPVVHSTEVHDRTYARSYIRALETGEEMVENNSELKMLFDIHRDAIPNASKDLTTTTIDGEEVAKIMIVVTNDNYGLSHPEWQKNFDFAKRLAQQMEKKYPGLLREVKLIDNRRYNQHLHPHALLLEVGGTENTLEEAKRSMDLFADVIASMIE
ncbi:stage II sporulation protein P [Natroniella sulfidigena]|uniref:stage II sporulation protein P n=1 Tax=Natroniella sulfidigena TaxID=723921 RepID=UPI00200B2D64|nr:stage II sporulation protein P [Natroniella sulfidigena]MCK8815913.1 stage II sporulation protein P [Natroniella sulfidigena]